MDRRRNKIPSILVFAFLFSCCVSIAAYGETVAPDSPKTLGEAIHAIACELESSDPSYFEKRASLLVVSPVLGDAPTPLPALLQVAARQYFQKKMAFRDVLTPDDLSFSIKKLDDETLYRLSSLGIDRVFTLDGNRRGQSLLLRVRAIWTDKGSFTPLMQTPVAYPEKLLRVTLADSKQWLVLTKTADELAPLQLPLRSDVVAQTKGRVLDLALVDMNQDREADLLLLLADRVELWLKTETAFSFRYMQPLPVKNAILSARFKAGKIVVCGKKPERNIFVRTTDHQQITRMSWNGQRFSNQDAGEGVPLACEDGTLTVGQLHPDGLLSVDGTLGMFLDIHVGSPSLFQQADGTVLFNHQPLSVRCGMSPVLQTTEAGFMLVCSTPVILPKQDQLLFYIIKDHRAILESRSNAEPGSILVLEDGTKAGLDGLFAARYLADKNKTVIDYVHR